MSHRSLLAAALGAATLAGCGGGGGRSALPAPPDTTRPTASVQFQIAVPAASGTPYRTIRPPHAARRAPKYVSPGTSVVSVYLLSTGGSSTLLGNVTVTPGASTQTVSVAAPIGSDSFEVDLADGGGHVLAAGYATATIASGAANTVNVTAQGVPAYATISPSTVTPALGGSSSIPLNVVVYDAAGYPISGTFANALTLGFTGPSADYALSTTTLGSSSAAAAATVTFDGATASPGRVYVLGVQKAFDAATTFRGGALATGAAVLTADVTGNLWRVDATTYAVSAAGSATGGAPGVAATTLAASPDGREALIGRNDGRIAYYDGASKSVTGTLNTTEPSVLAIAFDDAAQTAYALTTASGGGYALVAMTLGGGVGSTFVSAPAALPAAATGCGAVAPVAGNNGVAVACTDATYYQPAGGAWTSTAPGTTSLAQQYLQSNLIGAAGNGTTNNGLVAFSAGSTLAQAATYPAANGTPIALDATYQTVYAGVYNGVAAYDVSTGATGATLATATTGWQPIALLDDPGLYGGTTPRRADATVWAGTSTGQVAVISTATFAVTKTLGASSSLVGMGFVP